MCSKFAQTGVLYERQVHGGHVYASNPSETDLLSLEKKRPPVGLGVFPIVWLIVGVDAGDLLSAAPRARLEKKLRTPPPWQLCSPVLPN